MSAKFWTRLISWVLDCVASLLMVRQYGLLIGALTFFVLMYLNSITVQLTDMNERGARRP